MKPTLWLISILIAMALSWAVNEATDPVVEPETKIKYVDRTITRRDTISTTRPVYRTIYKQETETVNVCKPAPLKFDPYGFIPRHPVKVNRDSFTLTFWQPDSLRWMQDTYRIKPRSWGLTADAGAECGPNGCMGDVRVSVQYRRSTAYVGYGAGESGHGALVGVRLRLIGL